MSIDKQGWFRPSISYINLTSLAVLINIRLIRGDTQILEMQCSEKKGIGNRRRSGKDLPLLLRSFPLVLSSAVAYLLCSSAFVNCVWQIFQWIRACICTTLHAQDKILKIFIKNHWWESTRRIVTKLFQKFLDFTNPQRYNLEMDMIWDNTNYSKSVFTVKFN